MRGATFSDDAPRGGLMRLVSLSLLLGLLAFQAALAPAWAPSRGYDSIDEAAHRLIAPAAPRAIVDTRERDTPLVTARNGGPNTDGFGDLPLDLSPARPEFAARVGAGDSRPFPTDNGSNLTDGAQSSFRARAPPPSL